MTGFLHVLAPYESVARWLVTYALNALWMGAAITALAALIVRFCKPLDAAARYAVWYVALVAVMLGPLAATVAIQMRAPVHVEVFVSKLSDASRATPPVPMPPPTARPMIHVPPLVAYAAVGIWLLVALAGLARFTAGILVLARLKRDALPLQPQRRAELPLWCAHAATGRGRRVRLCVSDRIEVPIAVGLFDGMIVLPGHVLDEFEPADIDRFVLHELAHLERRDDWTTAIQRLLQVAAFFNPATYIIGRRLDLEREIACDDRVVGATHDVRSYAVGLTRMAQATAWPHRAIAAPAIFVTRKQLSLRVEELLTRRTAAPHRLAIAPAAVVLAASLGVVAVAMPLVPSISVVGTPDITAIRTTELFVFRHDGKRTTVDRSTVFVLQPGDDVRTLPTRRPAEADAVLKLLGSHISRAELDRILSQTVKPNSR